MNDIAGNIQHLRQDMNAALLKAGRAGFNVQLIAVSKTKSVEAVREAIAAGQKIFGENRVQEAIPKFTELRRHASDLELHLIGPLQTNKVQEAVAHFDVIQTLDRPKLAMALSKELTKASRKPRLYIEINIGHEPQKAGIFPEDLGEFLEFCRDKAGLTPEGLMCIPPHHVDPTPFFKTMKDLKDQFQLKHLSMGMSADYATAIACGATEIRVGSAIFGERDKTAS